jgi:hypothetical protein
MLAQISIRVISLSIALRRHRATVPEASQLREIDQAVGPPDRLIDRKTTLVVEPFSSMRPGASDCTGSKRSSSSAITAVTK